MFFTLLNSLLLTFYYIISLFTFFHFTLYLKRFLRFFKIEYIFNYLFNFIFKR